MMPAAHVSGPTSRPVDEAGVQARLAALRARVASLENEPAPAPTAAQTTAEQPTRSHVIIPSLVVCDDSGAYADEPFELPQPSGEVMGERLALMEERLRDDITKRLKSEIKEAIMAEVADLLSKDRYARAVEDGGRRNSLCCPCLWRPSAPSKREDLDASAAVGPRGT